MATRKPKTDAPAKTYTVLTPIEHDLVPYAPGEPIELTEDLAAPLLAVKAIEPAAAA